VNRVVVLGRGGAGKSAVAARFGAITGLPVIELDKHFCANRATSESSWRKSSKAVPQMDAPGVCTSIAVILSDRVGYSCEGRWVEIIASRTSSAIVGTETT
jgi:adenylate kinase family enzyme